MNLNNVDPTNKKDAWLVAALPKKFNEAVRREFILSGYDMYTAQAENGKEELPQDISAFAARAFMQEDVEEVQKSPLYTDPRALTTIATLAGSAIKLHETYTDLTDGYTDPDMELLYDVRTLWVQHFNTQLQELINDGDLEILQHIAETVYERRRDDTYGPPEGRTVTAITNVEAFDEPAVEIRLEHYSRHCEIRDDAGEIKTWIHDGKAYVPYSDLQSKLVDEAEAAFDSHMRFQFQTMLSDEERQWLRESIDLIYDRIDEYIAMEDYDRIFRDESSVPVLLRAVMNGIRKSRGFNFDEWLSGEDIYAEISEGYETHPQYKQELNKLSSPAGLSQKLGEFEDSRFIEIDRSGNQNQFLLKNPTRKGKRIEVEKPTDVLELPCMANIDEYLHEQKPVRYILFTVARLLMSLENDFSPQELAENFYSRYPWYDRETTMYQLDYEHRHGENYMPVNCTNDTEEFTTFCIGIDECDYNIYSSLPLKDELFDDDY